MPGFFDYVFDSDYKQRTDIEALRGNQHRAGRMTGRRLDRTEDRVEALEQELGEVALLCRALLTCLRQAGALDPAKLEAAMREVDLEDGVLDGKVTPEHERPRPPQARPVPPRPRKRPR